MYPNLFTLPEWLPLVGGAPITSFGIMMLAAFLTAGYVLKVELVRQGRQPDIAWDLLFWAVLGGIVGARVYYVLLNYPRFLDDPIGMVLSRAGMVWYGGFLLAGALVLRRIRTLGLPMGSIVDASAPALALAYGVGRLGCFLVGDDYGRPTDSWVGVAFPNGQPPTTVATIEGYFGIAVDPALVEKYGEVVPVHPTQLYETGISTLVFLLLWSLRSHRHRPGWLFALWLTLASAERFLVEFYRAKDDRFLGPLTLAQAVSVALAAVGVAWIAKLRISGGRR